MMNRARYPIVLLSWLLAARLVAGEPASAPALRDVLAAQTDLWGDAAMRLPEGPSYEFFAALLPPLRYVNAEFRHYPIVLSAPFSPVKARLVSNGSAVNAHARHASWRDAGIPVWFHAGTNEAVFGEDLNRLDGPFYAEGGLPIVQMSYAEANGMLTEEAWASVDPFLARHGAVFLRFTADFEAQPLAVELRTPNRLRFEGGAVRDEQGRVLVWADDAWRWETGRQRLTATVAVGQPVYLAVFTLPSTNVAARPLTAQDYQRGREGCVREWRGVLNRAAQLDLPEPVVANAWRALVVATLMVARDDQMNYSAGNGYDRLFCDESAVSVHALHLFGLTNEARRVTGPVLDYHLDRLDFHNAGFKLQLLARDYWLTRDAGFLRAERPRWLALAENVATNRQPQTGLGPREPYCGDIAALVDSLNSNANAWRGLRDLAAALADAGETNEAQRYSSVARDYRRVILDAVAKSERRDTQPPFIPVALFGQEQPYETLTATMRGSYWNLMSQYLLRSGVFAAQPEKARWIAGFVQQHGGLCMGLLRFDQHSGLFANTNAVDDLYTLGYVMWLLEQDDPDRALVTFYGKLAQGFTRDTFVGAEGTGLVPVDAHGRQMYLPPNTAGNALFLWTLRHLLVQDIDADDDGTPDTLRLLHATPRAWLREGATLRVRDLPTAFGRVSVEVKSRLARGEVVAEVQLPARPAQQTRLRLRLPSGWRPTGATIEGQPLRVDDRGTLELPSRPGRVTVRLAVRRG